MVVKVHGPVTAACPQRVLACLLEKDVDFEIVHPFGQVPAIEDGGFRLFESTAILRYYAAKYEKRGPNLLGNSLEERAVVDQWLEVEAHNFNDLVYNLVLQLVILLRMGKQGDSALALCIQQKLDKVFDVFEQRLSGSDYLAGDSFTLTNLAISRAFDTWWRTLEWGTWCPKGSMSMHGGRQFPTDPL
ncbi:Glutathione S-transferase F12 [Hibiscus syriacus]|uniref:glutathione transferase n=1 Tax=Hibiscus syriacus TaxID=106335 RepID=A0A6A2YYP0_HIBSY|nr:Glutathione S-transferase F12 [Hibiscus syriacus]